MNYQNFFQNRPTTKIAQDLLGRVLTYQDNGKLLGGLIVETEAYLGPKDYAAHSYNGRRSPANEGLYCPGGYLYIYAQRQYFFFDIATQERDNPEGVLVRAIEPTLGIETMIKNRAGKTGPLITNGPAKMMQAFGVTSRKWDLHPINQTPFSVDLTSKRPIKNVIAAPRIGVRQDDDWSKRPLRFYVAGNPYVSDMKKTKLDKNNGWELTKNKI
ncbi:DNA-3-methyladenine glycosylase [Lactobacillus mulieris]|uniref:DNA-3-methyladenine glycosylase n=1 Tax=Lactobacillus mulieris TaxID=2508708 RepID=UPI0014328920|nr:DNA-3-methyladenine glycosylase [Lactobacillus mulieris]MCF1783614.1 DNA-3-methyladenine glycosylase [Lactobacillus mulieris]MCW8104298.1 DNA-3-methyladenine glycosylase [Lactobacillus mulieris]MDK6803159.1 DNA-3-methyladenine glycosylase [Lactobacillus mulieris]MDK8382275.1 DNA-3-methyladenine glycosylase [Lactobacillus mulieris]MDT9620417.1 DNA-3-methyladenine glycosylase [Lactobacillus mulieris]